MTVSPETLSESSTCRLQRSIYCTAFSDRVVDDCRSERVKTNSRRLQTRRLRRLRSCTGARCETLNEDRTIPCSSKQMHPAGTWRMLSSFAPKLFDSRKWAWRDLGSIGVNGPGSRPCV